MLNLEDMKNYMHVDFIFDDNYIESLIEVSEIYISFMVGENYKADDKAVKLADLLQKKLIKDMYDNRSTEVTSTTKRDVIVTSILDKLSNY